MIKNIIIIIKKLFCFSISLCWCYIIIQSLQSLINNKFNPFSLFLDVFLLYVYVLPISLIVILFNLFKTNIERIISSFQLITFIFISFLVLTFPETVKNTFLFLLIVPFMMIYLCFNEIIDHSYFTIKFNIFLVLFPILLLSEFIYLATAFLIVDNYNCFLIIVNIILLFVFQTILITIELTKTIDSIDENEKKMKDKKED